MPSWTPRDYQRSAVEFVCQRFAAGTNAALFLDPGLGKTSITLAALSEMRSQQKMHRALIVAPRRVIHNVWPQEIKKWGFSLPYALIHGSPLERERQLLCRVPIHLTTPDLIPWLTSESRNFLAADYDTLVVDESTKFKNWSAARTKALRRALKHFERRLILTGTPAPNSLTDLFSQIFLLDGGEALGRTLTQFRSQFCRQGGYQNREWVFDGSRQADLESKIGHLALRLDAKDHLSMPPLITNDIWIDLPAAVQKDYRKFEKTLLLELEQGGTLTASSAASAYIKCRQLANGGGYDEETKESLHVHREKSAAVYDLHQELGGKPLLVAYLFRHDLGRLLEEFPHAPVICGGTTERETQRILEEWNARRVPILFVQPQSASHGLNMQSGGCTNVAWVGLPDSLEIYDQFNARVYRQGVSGGVRVHRILAKNTIERAVLERIEMKGATQTSLLDALRAYAQHQKRSEPCQTT